MEKNKKRIILLLAILMVFVLIPSTFATNYNDTTISEDSSFLKESQCEIADVNNIEKLNNDNYDIENGEVEDTIYVSKQGNDEFIGNYENPVLTINKAIELASNSNSSHKIIINNGTYTENELNINSELEIISNGTVIIDGNHEGLILNIDTKDKVKITGITFKNGWGGAIYINDAKVTIDNCIFVNNTSDYGGALYWNGNDGILTNSYFTQNHARIGSAIIWGAREESGYELKGNNGLIANVTFEDNDNRNTGAGCMGLAIYGSDVKVVNSSFINNNAPHISTGGCLHIFGDYIVVDNCLFENNSMDQAPAIKCDGDYVTIANNRFINNTISSNESARGGAIDIQSSNAQVLNNFFIENGGENCYNGGAISVIYQGYKGDEIINISKNKFINNSARYGGALFVDGGYESYCEFYRMFLNNNLFVGNAASTSAGIYVRYSDIENTVIEIKNNQFKDLIANYASAIFIDYSSVELNNNTLINCTSKDENSHIFNNDGFIIGNMTVTVNNNDTVELFAGKTINVNATVVDDMNNSISGGTIRFIVQGEDVDEDGFSLESGTATVNFKSSVVGMFLVSADYINGESSKVKTSIVIALPYDILIIFENQTGLSGETITIPIYVAVNRELLDKENITVEFNGKSLKVEVNDGIGYINLTLPEASGTYNLSATYDIETETQNITVKDNSVKIEVPEVNVTPNTGKLNIYLKDNEYNPLANHSINVKFANINKNIKTDQNGIATIDLDLDIGTYPVEIKYIGTKYKSTNASSTINVRYLDVIISSQNVTMDYGENIAYVVRLTDANFNPLVNQTLSISINNEINNLVTDSNGVVSILINHKPGSYNASVVYGGNNIYDSSNVTNAIIINSLAKLTSSNINMYYSDSKYYKVRVYGYDGKIVSDGEKVKITVNKKTYTRTIKNGYASLKISLTPGTYTIKTTYNGVTKSNKIVVKKVLTAKNLSKKKSKTIKFTAKLSKGSKILKYKKIKFKIKGKTYTAKTNKKGIASVSLKNLKVGKYTIYTYYSKSYIKNTITVKK